MAGELSPLQWLLTTDNRPYPRNQMVLMPASLLYTYVLKSTSAEKGGRWETPYHDQGAFDWN